MAHQCVIVSLPARQDYSCCGHPEQEDDPECVCLWDSMWYTSEVAYNHNMTHRQASQRGNEAQRNARQALGTDQGSEVSQGSHTCVHKHRNLEERSNQGDPGDDGEPAGYPFDLLHHLVWVVEGINKLRTGTDMSILHNCKLRSRH